MLVLMFLIFKGSFWVWWRFYKPKKMIADLDLDARLGGGTLLDQFLKSFYSLQLATVAALNLKTRLASSSVV